MGGVNLSKRCTLDRWVTLLVHGCVFAAPRGHPRTHLAWSGAHAGGR